MIQMHGVILILTQLNNVGFGYICFPDRDAWNVLEEKLMESEIRC